MANPNQVQLIGVNGLPLSVAPQVADKEGGTLVSELHGRFYQEAYQGKEFVAGMSLTSINNVTFTTGTLGATCTPVLGLWNPGNSGVNAEILNAVLSAILTALTATGGAPFAWAFSVGNNAAISTGAKGYNTKTWLQNSACQNMSGVALTGLTNNLTVIGASQLSGGPPVNASEVYTVAGVPLQCAGSREDIDGAFIIPPGGILALLATTTPVAMSAASRLLWNENAV